MSDRMKTVWRLARGLLVAAAISLALMAALAACVVWARLHDDAIQAINQVIKLASIFTGVFVCVGRGGRRGFFLGGAVGLGYMALGHGLYALTAESIQPAGLLAVEFAAGALLGALSGALVSNLPGRAG